MFLLHHSCTLNREKWLYSFLMEDEDLPICPVNTMAVDDLMKPGHQQLWYWPSTPGMIQTHAVMVNLCLCCRRRWVCQCHVVWPILYQLPWQLPVFLSPTDLSKSYRRKDLHRCVQLCSLFLKEQCKMGQCWSDVETTVSLLANVGPTFIAVWVSWSRLFEQPVGATKIISCCPLISEFFGIVNTHISYRISR